jgi:hypothetical protein
VDAFSAGGLILPSFFNLLTESFEPLLYFRDQLAQCFNLTADFFRGGAAGEIAGGHHRRRDNGLVNIGLE